MKFFIEHILIEYLRRIKSPKSSHKRRIFAASLYCLLAFFARYSVHYGHDCNQINPWQENETVQKSISVSKMDHCHQSNAGADNTHEHSDCQVCHSYEELVNTTFEKFSPSLSINLTKAENISEASVQIIFSIPRTAYRPRGPPSIQII